MVPEQGSTYRVLLPQPRDGLEIECGVGGWWLVVAAATLSEHPVLMTFRETRFPGTWLLHPISKD